jgi:SRSO17 transposase
VDIETLKGLRKELDLYLDRFADCIKTAPSRDLASIYVRGQLSNLERKTLAAIALDAGIPPRTLQELLEIHRWSEAKVRDRVQTIIRDDHADPDALGVIDETGCPKKGAMTAGVQPQYCGALGKVGNCVVTVHLGYVAKGFHALLDGDLYVPEAWFKDRARCRKAGIPKTVVYRTKCQIAVDLLAYAVAQGVPLRYLTADENYGRCATFRHEVADLGLTYVVEVPCSLTGWTRRPVVVEPSETRGPRAARGGKGRPARRARLAPGAPRPRRLDAIYKRRSHAWETFYIKDTEKGPVVWEARAVRFFPREKTLPGPELWLLVARNVLDGEVKYFFSNAPKETPLEVLLTIAFGRAHVEQLIEESKGEVGLDHFEVRGYRPIRRHLMLSMVSLLFLEEQTRRLQDAEKKSVVEPLPGPRSGRGPTRARLGPPGADTSVVQRAPQDPVLAGDQRTRRPLPLCAALPSTRETRHQTGPPQEMRFFVAL